MKTRSPLPSWATAHETKNVIIADPDKFYPAILKEIADAGVPEGFPRLDPKRPGRYWVEVAYQFAKLDLQFAVGPGKAFTINIRSDGDRKKRWNMKQFASISKKLMRADLRPEHRNADLSKIDQDEYRATYLREAREHYKRMRGFIPG